MDALLKVQKNNRRKFKLSNSTTSRTSRTSFGSLLQSIEQTDDRTQQDETNSDYSTPKAKHKDESTLNRAQFKNKTNLVPSSSISYNRQKSPQNNQSFQEQKISQIKPDPYVHTFQKKSVVKSNKSNEKNPPSTYLHANKVLQKLGKSFVTENSSKSSNLSSNQILKTSYVPKGSNQKPRKKWGTDCYESRNNSDDESSFQSFDSDIQSQQMNEIKEMQQKQPIQNRMQQKSQILLSQSIRKVRQMNNEKIQISSNNKTTSMRPFSNFNQKQLLSQRMQIQKNNIISSNFQSKGKPRQLNSGIPEKRNETDFNSQSQQISSLAKKFKNQRQIASLRSDFSHYSKNSNRSKNSRSKTNYGATGRRGEAAREYSIAIFEYCSHQIGLACYNSLTGEFHLCQLVENMTYFRTISTIQTFSPLEIIYSKTFQNTLLIKRLREKFRQTSFKAVFRRCFDEEAGYGIYIKTESKQSISSTSNFLAFSCFNALILHLEVSLQNKFKHESLNVQWHRLDKLLIIQPEAIVDLEIFYNYQTKKNQKCLIQNFTCITFGGTRMLRANFLQPPTEEKIILQRQKLVEKMLENPTLFQFVQKQFYTYKYYQPVTSKFVQSPKEQNFKSLKSYLSSILLLSRQCLSLQKLYQSLQDRNAFQLPIFEKLDSKLQSHKIKLLKSIIEQNFDENILKNFEEMKNKKDKYIFLFKVEKIEDQFAIVTRKTYTQTVQTIKEYFNDVKMKAHDDIHLMFNDNRGYFFKVQDTVDLHNLTQRLQQNLVQISSRGRIVTFSTQILSSLNNRLKETQQILIFQSESLLRKIIEEIQKNIDILFEINQIISTIDMIMSFVRYIHRYSIFVKFNKPKFVKGANKLSVQKLKPIWVLTPQNFDKSQLEEINFDNGGENNNIVLLEKSPNSISQNTFMYSMAYVVILSQMGCFVPAQNVQLTLFDSMLSKIQVRQTTEKGLSRFQLNLVKVQNILDNCFDKNEGRSIVLMDQIVRGTQHQEECALSLATIQWLQRNRGMSIVTTSDRMLIQFLLYYEDFKTVQILRTKVCEQQSQAIEEITEESIGMMKELNFDKKFIEGFEEIKIQATYSKTSTNQNQSIIQNNKSNPSYQGESSEIEI